MLFHHNVSINVSFCIEKKKQITWFSKLPVVIHRFYLHPKVRLELVLSISSTFSLIIPSTPLDVFSRYYYF